MGNADLLSNKSRLTNSTRHSRWALRQEKREQLEPKCHKTRTTLKYSFDFWKSRSWCSISLFVLFCFVLFVSISAHRKLKLEQNYHNTRKNIECQVCYVGSVWVTQSGGFYFPSLNRFCLLVHVRVHACYCARLHVSVLCFVSRDEPGKSTSPVECTNMSAEHSHALLLSSRCQLLSSHAIPSYFALFHYSYISPFRNPTISAPLYFHASFDEALSWHTQISASYCWIIDRCERL